MGAPDGTALRLHFTVTAFPVPSAAMPTIGAGTERQRARRALTALAKPWSNGSVISQEMHASVMLWP